MAINTYQRSFCFNKESAEFLRDLKKETDISMSKILREILMHYKKNKEELKKILKEAN
jgi:hypothetical protein